MVGVVGGEGGGVSVPVRTSNPMKAAMARMAAMTIDPPFLIGVLSLCNDNVRVRHSDF